MKTDTSALFRRLLAKGYYPVLLTASENEGRPQQHLYHLAQLLDEWPNDGQQFLAYRILDPQTGGRGDVYLCYDNPDEGPASIVRVLDLDYVPSSSFGCCGDRYEIDLHMLATYAMELQTTGVAGSLDEAVARAIANAAKARFINWSELKDDLIDGATEIQELTLAADFLDRVITLAGVDDDLPLTEDGEPEESVYREVLTQYTLAYCQMMGAN
jgi:hypothetical protein